MRAYSTDLRERIVRSVQAGRSQRETARVFGIGVSSVKRYLHQLRQRGTLAPKPIPGAERHMSPEQAGALRAQFKAHPDVTLEHHCAWWEEAHGKPGERCHAVARAASAALDAYKKLLAASERDEAARAIWREEGSHLDARQMVLVDESGTHVALTPLYAWAPKEQRAEGQVPRNRGRTPTLLAALSLEGMQAPWTMEGGTDALAFETYVREGLAPTLKPGQIVILDNLAAHQGETVRQVVEARGCPLRFLPSYSPDLTPSEEAFSKIKTGLRRAAARGHEALLDASGQAVAWVTKDDALGWLHHAGYRPLARSP